MFAGVCRGSISRLVIRTPADLAIHKTVSCFSPVGTQGDPPGFLFDITSAVVML